MQFSKKWLQEFFDDSLDDLDLDEILTSAGIEVEDVKDLAKLSEDIVVGEIIDVKKHPDADRLNVCHVDIGSKDFLQIVCGAPNARKGIKVPCAKVGAKLPNFQIKKAKLRGVDSFGMLCSAKEINLGDDSDGLYELNSETELGESIVEALALNDSIYYLSITPNRADCLSMEGIAREVSALSGLPIRKENTCKNKVSIENNQDISIKESIACPRYCGVQLQGINNNNKLPDSISQYLERGGIALINPVVDITNYVLLKSGQPLHAFDQKKINGKITIRNANQNEHLHLLNDQEIKFQRGELVIADESGPIALAGIMGGASSAISVTTTNIFLESAYFDPIHIAGKARSFGLNTESSHRFERGVDFNNSLFALEYAASLIVKYCGGKVSNSKEINSKLPQREPIKLHTSKVISIMGIKISDNDIKNVLEKLNFIYKKNEDEFIVTPPSYRFDLNIEEDLIEEVIRIIGYNNIPAIYPHMQANMLALEGKVKSIENIKDRLVSLGYNEVISYSFITKETEIDFHGNKNSIELKNPIASNLNVMRSKIWGSHIETLRYNLNRAQKTVRIFEIASVYKAEKKGYEEIKILSGLAYGDQIPEQCGEKNRDINFFDIKGDIENTSSNTLIFEKPKKIILDCLHPGETAEIFFHNESVGWLGKLHPLWQQKFELPKNTYLYEINMKSIIHTDNVTYTIPGKFTPVRRDISVIIDKDLFVGEVITEIYNSKISNLVKLEPFDVYDGDGVENTKKSIAFLVLIQDTYKTLEDKDVNIVVDQITNILKTKFGAVLR